MSAEDDCEPGFHDEYNDEYADEPCGSCDQCEGDLYEDDAWTSGDGSHYCNHCYWLLTGGAG